MLIRVDGGNFKEVEGSEPPLKIVALKLWKLKMHSLRKSSYLGIMGDTTLVKGFLQGLY